MRPGGAPGCCGLWPGPRRPAEGTLAARPQATCRSHVPRAFHPGQFLRFLRADAGLTPATTPRPKASTAGEKQGSGPARCLSPLARRGGGASGGQGGQAGDACLGSRTSGGEVCEGAQRPHPAGERSPRSSGRSCTREQWEELELAARREAGSGSGGRALCAEQCPRKSARGHPSLAGRATRSGLLSL